MNRLIKYSNGCEYQEESFKSTIGDFFDFQNREKPMELREFNWINRHISQKNQIEIFGTLINQKYYDQHLKEHF